MLARQNNKVQNVKQQQKCWKFVMIGVIGTYPLGVSLSQMLYPRKNLDRLCKTDAL